MSTTLVGIETLVLQLNRSTNLCFQPVQILADTAQYTDMFVYESKFRYTQAMRLLKKSDGSLDTATCLNFDSAPRFDPQRSLVQALGDTAVAIATPDLYGNQKTSQKPKPVVADTDFGYAAYTQAAPRSYQSLSASISSDVAPYRDAFDLITRM